MNPTFGERALRFYLSVVQFFWRPMLDAGRLLARNPREAVMYVLRRVVGAFVLKTAGVAVAEWGAPNVGRVLVGIGGIFDFWAAVPVALVGALLLYWFLIAIGLIQVPVGEIMEVLRELGQLLRLQDPVKRDREGNIRVVDSQRLLAWGMLLLVVPGMALMSTTWLGVFPNWYVYAMLLLITVGGSAYGVFAAARGRKVGAGLDLLIGMNGYLVVGGTITLFYLAWMHFSYPRAMAVFSDGSEALTGTGLPWETDWQLASYLANVADQGGFGGVDITAYPGALGALVVIGLVGFIALVLHIVTIVVLVRILRRPPERELLPAQEGDEKTDVAAPATAASANVITSATLRGPGHNWYQAFMAAAPFGVAAVALWLLAHYWVSEWTCRFGATAWSFALVCAIIAFVVTLVWNRWEKAARILAVVAVVVLLVGYTRHVFDTWQQGAVACSAPVHRPEPPVAPSVSAPATPTVTTTIVPAPVPRAEPPRPRADESGAIASYFADHRTSCPETARRSWRTRAHARASCEIEALRRDYPELYASDR